MKDVQSEKSRIRIDIDKVGVKNVRKEFIIPKNGTYYFLSKINCYVNLPSKFRGIHMSRNIEAINEIISEVSRKPVKTLEELSENLCFEILKRHEYASKAYVEIETYLPYKNDIHKVFVKCKCYKNGKIKRKISIKIKTPYIMNNYKIYVYVELYDGIDIREIIDEVIKYIVRDLNPINIREGLKKRFGKEFNTKIIYEYID